MTKVLARAPGRVNLIGDHTDHTGGLAMPMAIDRETVVEIDLGTSWVELISESEDEPAIVFFDDPREPSTIRPEWARYVAGVVEVLRPPDGGRGFVRSNLPIGAGLSSSASLEVAVALALGFRGSPLDLALLCQRAEQVASGVPCGILDQLTCAAGVEGHALLLDCHDLQVTPIALPEEVEIVVVDSGTRRQLATSFYGVRRAQCEEAETLIGPLRSATLETVSGIATDDLRRRARHVVTENERVRCFAEALRAADIAEAGRLMVESHVSLRDDFDVSTRILDDMVDHLMEQPGVRGARLTGAGFGGCVVAMVDRGTTLDVEAWRVRPSAGASVDVVEAGDL